MNDSWLIVTIFALFVLQWLWLLNDRGRSNRRSRALEARFVKLVRHLGVEETDPLEPSDEVKALAFTPGQQIAAIKLYREQTGADLKEAADAIQHLERSTYKVMP